MTGDRPAQEQGVGVEGPFVGLDGLEVHGVAHDMVLSPHITAVDFEGVWLFFADEPPSVIVPLAASASISAAEKPSRSRSI